MCRSQVLESIGGRWMLRQHRCVCGFRSGRSRGGADLIRLSQQRVRCAPRRQQLPTYTYLYTHAPHHHASPGQLQLQLAVYAACVVVRTAHAMNAFYLRCRSMAGHGREGLYALVARSRCNLPGPAEGHSSTASPLASSLVMPLCLLREPCQHQASSSQLQGPSARWSDL